MELQTLYTRNYRLLIISTTVIAFFFGMQSNTLPLYVLELGGTATHVGIVSGIGSITALFFRVIAGLLLDRKGRKIVYVSGISLYVLATIGYVTAPNLTLVLLFKAVTGIGMCAVTSSIGAILSDIMPDRLMDGLFTITVAQTFGAILAPTIGIFIADRAGYRLLYAITGIGLIAALLISLRMSYEKYAPAVNTDAADKQPFHIRQFVEMKAIVPAVCMVFYGLAQCGIMGFVASYGKTLGIQNIGFFFIINGLVTFLIRPVLGRFSEERYRNKLFTFGAASLLAALILFLLAKNAVLLGAAAVAYSMGYCASQPILNALALSRAPDGRKGAANATYYIFWDMGYGFGSVALGASATALGYHSIYFIGIVALAVLVAIYWKLLSKKRSEATV